jgi:hypothetical protein
MLNCLRNFEQSALSFSPIVLVGLGLAAVLAGLFLWLGGLGFRKIVAAILGTVSGSICGFFIIGHNIAALVSAAIAAVIAVIFERIFITVLAAGLAAALGLAILAGPDIEKSNVAIPVNQDEASGQRLTVSISGSLRILKVFAVDCIDVIKQSCSGMPKSNWAVIAALIVIFILAGLYIYRLASAFCCATLGTMLIFAGMILLLLYKTSAPISRICYSRSFYLTVFLAMIFFGTLEQMLLCRAPKKQPRFAVRLGSTVSRRESRRAARKKQKSKTQDAHVEVTHDWRTA